MSTGKGVAGLSVGSIAKLEHVIAYLQVMGSAADGKYASKVKAVRELEALAKDWPSRVSIRFLRNYTLESIDPLLRFECARSKVAASVSFSDFDNFEQEVLDPASATNTVKHDLVVLALWLDGLLPANDVRSFSPAEVFERVRRLLDKLLQDTGALLAVTAFLPPFFALANTRTARAEVSFLRSVAELNRRLAAYASSTARVHLIDLPALAGRLGEHAALDARFWYLYKAPLRNELLDLLAAELGAMVSAVKGGGKKVLVLDCDNTLWGGIVGEDGLDGIQLDPNGYPGSAFYDFQRQILELKSRGVLLALCSKNNEADALAVFEQHPHCLLKKQDFVSWRINWNDKASNMLELARSLNLGIDAFVLVEDSSLECDLVRTELPEVTVLQVPERRFELPNLLRSYRGFDMLAATEEDSQRTHMYQQERQREESRRDFQDLATYLKSIGLVAVIRPAGETDVARVAQLTQKTNQFNLTTHRYTEGDIEKFLSSHECTLLTMRVKDRFGDYGLTGLGILRYEGELARIDTFLISCRVLGRRLELVLLGRLIAEASRRRGVRMVKGLFLPTRRNEQVGDFYDRAGFKLLSTKPGPGNAQRAKEYGYGIGSPFIEVPDYISVLE